MISLHNNLSTDLEFINQWIKINILKSNISQTKYISFQKRFLHNSLPPLTIEGETLTSMNHTKFLGVQIDENFNWKFQINDVFSK